MKCGISAEAIKQYANQQNSDNRKCTEADYEAFLQERQKLI